MNDDIIVICCDVGFIGVGVLYGIVCDVMDYFVFLLLWYCVNENRELYNYEYCF